MFGKVLKYEFKANGKVLFPAYLFGLLGSLILRLLGWLLSLASPTVGGYADRLFGGVVGLYAVAVVLFSIGYIIIRFYRSMVGKEAYLTLTLPVNTTAHIWARFLSGFVFSVLGLLACLATLNIYDFTSFEIAPLSSQDWVILMCLAGIVVILLAYVVMEAYFCCGVGSQFKSKVLSSVVTFFIVHNAIGIVTVAVLAPIVINMEKSGQLQSMLDQLTVDPYAATGLFPTLLLVIFLYCGVIFTAQFLTARHLFAKKLNLE